MNTKTDEGSGTAGRAEREVRPLVWVGTGHLREVCNGNTMNVYAAPDQDRFADVPLYVLTSDDVAAVNAARKDRAWKTLRRLDLCRCDHNEYCQHCYPVEFRPGGVWHGG